VGPWPRPRFRSRRRLRNDNLDAAVLGLAHPVGGRDQKILLLTAKIEDAAGWHALFDQRCLNSVGTASDRRWLYSDEPEVSVCRSR
jgi:hypothetical protein